MTVAQFQQFQKKIATNLVTGSLGSGKTTLIRHLLSQKPSNEKWGLLVNEFGAIGIDGAIYEGNDGVNIKQIPGGCICCTAKSELKTSIQELINTQNIDRLIIEPTGLGEPDSLVDLLQSDFFASRFDIQTVFSVFDCSATTVDDFNTYTILQNLAQMADIVIFNKTDLVNISHIDALRQYADALYPPKYQVITTQQCKITPSLIAIAHSNAHSETRIKLGLNESSHQHSTTAPQESQPLPYQPKAINNLSQRIYKNELNTQSIGWIFNPEQAFEWTKLLQLFNDFNNNTFGPIKRAKGVFRVGEPWMLFQWANNHVSREYIAYRRDSRMELLLDQTSTFDFEKFETQLQDCMK